MVELLRTVIVNVLESLESGDGLLAADGLLVWLAWERDRTGNGNGKWIFVLTF